MNNVIIFNKNFKFKLFYNYRAKTLTMLAKDYMNVSIRKIIQDTYL